MLSLRNFSVVFLVTLASGMGCRSRLNRSHASPDESAKPAAAVSAPRAAHSSALVSRALRAPRSLRPVGRPYPVEPGLGLGPIMFGATVPTLERHMGMKCEELTATRCRMVTVGVEFELLQGTVSAIQIHRFDRPVEGNAQQLWGVFAGGIPPNIMMAMVPEAVIEGLGKPRQSVEVKEKNPNNTVRRDTYDGMVLEYDLNPENQRLMLGGIRIVKKG